jgi:hypothetical protein
MDAVFLRQNLDPDVDIVTRVFGLPRGGNQDWANFVDQTVSAVFMHIHFKCLNISPKVPGLIHVHNKVCRNFNSGALSSAHYIFL